MAKKATIVVLFLVAGTLVLIWKFHTTEPKTIPAQTPAEVCLNNLRLIESGKMQWSLERHKTANQSPTWEDLRPFIGRGSNGVMPECPLHGVYTPGTVAAEPSCSIHGTLPDPL
jgi:hypothetical protein